MTFLGELVMRVRADTTTLSSDFDTAGRKIQNFGRTVNATGGNVGGLTDKFGGLGSRVGSTVGNFLSLGSKLGMTVIGFQGLASAITGAGNSLFSYNASMETSRVAFGSLLGSAQKADSFLRDLQKFADTTPFEFPDLVT